MENKDISFNRVLTEILESEKLGSSEEVGISHQLPNSEGGQCMWGVALRNLKEPER